MRISNCYRPPENYAAQDVFNSIHMDYLYAIGLSFNIGLKLRLIYTCLLNNKNKPFKPVKISPVLINRGNQTKRAIINRNQETLILSSTATVSAALLFYSWGPSKIKTKQRKTKQFMDTEI